MNEATTETEAKRIEALAKLNRLPGPKITTNETWNSFKRNGFKGIDG